MINNVTDEKLYLWLNNGSASRGRRSLEAHFLFPIKKASSDIDYSIIYF